MSHTGKVEEQPYWPLFSSSCEKDSLPTPKPEDLSNYHLFVSEGYASLTEGGATVAVKICDTGATQSLIASHVLSLSDQTSAGASVLIQGVGMDVIRVPLHHIHLPSVRLGIWLESDLVYQ